MLRLHSHQLITSVYNYQNAPDGPHLQNHFVVLNHMAPPFATNFLPVKQKDVIAPSPNVPDAKRIGTTRKSIVKHARCLIIIICPRTIIHATLPNTGHGWVHMEHHLPFSVLMVPVVAAKLHLSLQVQKVQVHTTNGNKVELHTTQQTERRPKPFND